MPIDGGRVGPIGLDRHDVEAVLFDQPAGDRRAGAIEFARTVAGFAQQDDTGVGVTIKGDGEGGIVDIGQRLGCGGETTRGGQRQRPRL